MKKKIEEICNKLNRQQLSVFGATEELLNLFSVSGSLLVEKCKLLETTDDFINCDVTNCCNVGPIVNENYCPKCGKMIIRNDR